MKFRSNVRSFCPVRLKCTRFFQETLSNNFAASHEFAVKATWSFHPVLVGLTLTPLSTTSCHVMYPVPDSRFLPAVDTMSNNLQASFNVYEGNFMKLNLSPTEERVLLIWFYTLNLLSLVETEEIPYITEIVSTNEIHQVRVRCPERKESWVMKTIVDKMDNIALVISW